MMTLAIARWIGRHWVPIVAVLAIAAILFMTDRGGYRRGVADGKAEFMAYLENAARAIEAANARADQAAADFEAWKRKQRPKVITVYKEIDRALETPAARAWADQPIPDSVRDALAAAPCELGACEPAGTVPPVSGLDLEPGDESRSRAPVPGSADLGSGVPSEAPPTV